MAPPARRSEYPHRCRGVVVSRPRFASPVAPASDPGVPASASAPSTTAVTASPTAVAPVPAEIPAGRPALVTLASFGDVLTDADLCALLQVSPRWAEVQRRNAKAAGVAPDLPARIPSLRLPRYRKCDVESWMRTGSSKPVERASLLRRIS
jgi:hypothetical protein